MSKPGSGGITSNSRSNIDRRNRINQLATDVIDLSKDPYFMKNHLGSFECKLCLTMHNNEGNYLAHTQGKKHKTNIARRGKIVSIQFYMNNNLKFLIFIIFNGNLAAREARDQPDTAVASLSTSKPKAEPRRTPKIGLPGYKIVKQRNTETGQYSLLIEIDYPKIEEGLQPRHRLMSCYEQKREPPNPKYRYLLFAAEPYETIAFKIPSWEIEKDARKSSLLYTNWDKTNFKFTVCINR